MKKAEFIKLLEEYLDNTGMSDGCYDVFFSVGDVKNVNTTIYIDKDNCIWITDDESVKRIKTSINVDNIIEIRYSEFGSDEGRFFVICQDDTGLDFCEGKIGFFTNGYYGSFKKATDWFTENPVSWFHTKIENDGRTWTTIILSTGYWLWTR